MQSLLMADQGTQFLKSRKAVDHGMVQWETMHFEFFHPIKLTFWKPVDVRHWQKQSHKDKMSKQHRSLSKRALFVRTKLEASLTYQSLHKEDDYVLALIYKFYVTEKQAWNNTEWQGNK